MKLRINNNTYTLKVGVRAFMNAKKAFGDKEVADFGFDEMVVLAYESIKDKKDLTLEQLDAHLDQDFGAVTQLMEQISAIKGLGAEAKKQAAK